MKPLRLIGYNLNIIKKDVKASDQRPAAMNSEYNDKLVIIEGESIKSHEYIIPKSTVDHYDGKNLFLNISRNALLEFKI